jgi:hypothetical protein
LNETLHIDEAASHTAKLVSLYHIEAASYIIELRHFEKGNDNLIESKALQGYSSSISNN